MKIRKILPILLYAAILLALFFWILNAFGLGKDNLSYSQIVELFENEQVKSFAVEEDTIYLQLHTPYEGKLSLECSLADVDSFRGELGELFAQQRTAGILESYHFVPEDKLSPFDSNR